MPSIPILFKGGRVFTANPEAPFVESLVIGADGRVAFVGAESEAIKHAGPAHTHETIDLKGGVALPGFVDAHSHIMMTGAALLKAQLRDAPDLKTIQKRVKDWAEANPTAPRVLGIGWLFASIPGGVPTRQMLDEVVSDRPVYLDAFDLHSAWCNSKALEELGVDETTEDPIGGKFVKDAEGKLTGHLLETAAFNLVWPIVNKVDDATADSYIRATCQAYNETGVTSAVDMALEMSALRTMQRAEKNGSLTIRVVGHWAMHRKPDPEQELEQVRKAAQLVEETKDSPLVRVAGIKIIIDGVIDACTAAMIEPYVDGTNSGPIWDPESLERVVLLADKLGLQIALHAIGDAAIRSAIDALEKAQKVNGTSGRRHRIEHLEYTDQADVRRLAPLGITASMQPVHSDPSLISTWLANLGEPRNKRGFAWKEFLDAGTTLAFGTDTPTAPHMPLPNMYIATTRKAPLDHSVEPYNPENAMPLPEAVIHATRDSAWASFLEGKVGMLKEGLEGDVVVLDRDAFREAEEGRPEGLLETGVVLTMLGGKVVHRAV